MNVLKKIVSFFVGGYKTNNHLRIFKNTLYWIDNDVFLKNSVEQSIRKQEIIKENDKVLGNISVKTTKCKINVTNKRTLESARFFNNKKVCVLNFASAINPGGGVTVSKTPSGQEECLCRVSTLYKCLDTDKNHQLFYIPHKTTGNNIHNDDIIYTPNVVVFKDDENNLLKESEWFSVDVISCAAPNIGQYQKGEPSSIIVDNNDLKHILEKRARRIFEVVAHHNVEILILGAFGCGAFGNSPETVASAFKTVLLEFENYYEKIVFAVFSRTNDLNYQVFKSIITKP